MRNVSVHWLLLVCLFATPLSYGQAPERASLTPCGIAAAMAKWSGSSLSASRDAVGAFPVFLGCGKPKVDGVLRFQPIEACDLPARASETSAAQPAGP